MKFFTILLTVFIGLWFFFDVSLGSFFMLCLSIFVMGLGIFKDYEPLLLIPIGFGAFVANIPGGGMSSHYFAANVIEKSDIQASKRTIPEQGVSIYLDSKGKIHWEAQSANDIEVAYLSYSKKGMFLKRVSNNQNLKISGIDVEDQISLKNSDVFQIGNQIYELNFEYGLLASIYKNLLKTGIIPPLIFMGVGAMTDFGPLMRNVGLAFYGAAAQIGIFIVFFLALFSGMFSLNEAASLGIIGGADGPTAVYLTTKLAPDLLGPIAVAAYSYMALVPVIIPWVVRRFTSLEDRRIHMRNQEKAFGTQNVEVSKRTKIAFPIVVTLICGLIVPSSTVLIGMLMFGNLVKEIGASVERLSGVAKGALINILTIFLGLSVGGTMEATTFLNVQTVGIIAGGLFAFGLSVAGGIIAAKIYNSYARKAGWKLTNPLIGATGLSAVPMASRVANDLALKDDPSNNIIHYCMASNIAGVIGSAVAAGFFLNQLG